MGPQAWFFSMFSKHGDVETNRYYGKRSFRNSELVSGAVGSWEIRCCVSGWVVGRRAECWVRSIHFYLHGSTAQLQDD